MPTGTTHGVNTLEDRSAPAPDKLPLSSLAPRQAQTVRNQAWPSTCKYFVRRWWVTALGRFAASGYFAVSSRENRLNCPPLI